MRTCRDQLQFDTRKPAEDLRVNASILWYWGSLKSCTASLLSRWESCWEMMGESMMCVVWCVLLCLRFVLYLQVQAVWESSSLFVYSVWYTGSSDSILDSISGKIWSKILSDLLTVRCTYKSKISFAPSASSVVYAVCDVSYFVILLFIVCFVVLSSI